MSKLSELEKQAKKLNEQIENLKGDGFAKKLVDDMSIPGTYIKFDNSWVVNVKATYHKNDKSFTVEGVALCSGDSVYPWLQDDFYTNYSLDCIRDEYERGHLKVYHNNPEPILTVLDKGHRKYDGVITRLYQLAGSGRENAELPKPVELPKLDNMKHAEAALYAADHFDGACFKTVTDNSLSVVTNFYLFRVVDMGDDTRILKCIRIKHTSYKEKCDRVVRGASQEIRLPSIDEMSQFVLILDNPSSRDDWYKIYIAGEGKTIKVNLKDAQPAYYSEILAIADTCSNEMDDKQFKVLNQLRTAIGLKPTEKDEKTVHN